MKWFYDLFGIGRRQKRYSRGRGPLSGPERLEAREVPATLTWNYNGGFPGDWHNVANWSTMEGNARVPTIDDDVVFAGGTGECRLSAHAVCRSLFQHDGEIDLAGFTLKIDAGAGPMPPGSWIYGGEIRSGILELYRGRLDVWHGTVGADLIVGPGNATGDALLSIASSIDAGYQTSMTVRDHGQVNIVGNIAQDPILLGTSVDVKSGGVFDFTALADIVSVRYDAVFTVRAGGVLGLNSRMIMTNEGTTGYIANSGTVQKTTATSTLVGMGLKNEDCSALLKIDAAGEHASLTFEGVVPGATAVTILQTHGHVQLYDGAELVVSNGYTQLDGTLSVKGRANGGSFARLLGTEGGVADILGGTVKLFDDANSHGSMLSSDLHFKFGAASTLEVGFSFIRNDMLIASEVTITAGAKVEVTHVPGGAPPSEYYIFEFLRVVGPDKSITGDFTLVGFSGDLLKENAETAYRLRTGVWT